MKLKDGLILSDPATDVRFRIIGFLDSGGFGAAHLAEMIRPDGSVGETVCLKASEDRDSWLYESYFGFLIEGQRRAVQQVTTFPFSVRVGRSTRSGYAIVSEYMPHGTVMDALGTGTLSDPKYVRRQLKQLLKLLALLHGSSATHGDIHPGNVFVSGHKELVLGDFGLAGHHLMGHAKKLSGYAPGFVPPDIYQGKRERWEPSDDLYELGVFSACMLADDLVFAKDVRRALSSLPLPDDLRQFVLKLVAPRRSDRFPGAGAALDALAPESKVWAPPPRSLKGMSVVFTGTLPNMLRAEAKVRVIQAGGYVQGKVNGNTQVVVVGDPSIYYRVSPRQGTKLADVWQRAKSGQRIALVGETDFKRMTRLPKRNAIAVHH